MKGTLFMQPILNHSEPHRTETSRGTGTERHCPGCGQRLSLRQIIEMMHGSGFEEYVWVKLADGSVALVEAGKVNPTLVEVLD
jgi:hypothetical protein